MVVLVSPPMYRASPLWYSDGLAEVMNKFSTIFSQDRPVNLLLMPSFPTPVFDQDGVHLSPLSGLDYLFFLFDAARETLATSVQEPEAAITSGSEATRVLTDRVF